MRVLVLVVVMLMLPTTSEASKSCMSKTEARKHFGLVHIYWHGTDHCWDATSTRLHHLLARKTEHKIDQGRSQDANRQDSGRQDSDRQESSRQDTNRQDSNRQVAALLDANQQASNRQASKPQESTPPDAVRQEARLQDARLQDSRPQGFRPQDSRKPKSPWQASMSQMAADEEPVQAAVHAPVQRLAQRAWADRWVDIEPAHLPLADRWVDIAPVTPPLSKSAPDPELRMMVLGLVLIVVALMLAILEVLFRAARGPSARDQAVA